MASHTRESLAFNHILKAMNIPCRILRDFRLMLAGNLFCCSLLGATEKCSVAKLGGPFTQNGD